MLLQFTVENYLSFADKAVFSMRASGDKDHPGHVIAGKIPVVRGAAIYGANAAGKSNLVTAMAFARDIIAPRGRNTTSIAEVRPFRLCEENDRPSSFNWHFVHADRIWNYGFSITGERVVEEYLFARNESGGQERKWFERETDAGGNTSITFGPEFLNTKPKSDGQLLRLIGPRTPKDELFLRHCRLNQIASVETVFEWFEDVLLIVSAEADYEPLLIEANEDQGLRRFLSEHLRDAGTGIDAIESYERPIDESKLKNLHTSASSDNAGSFQNWLSSIAPGESRFELSRGTGSPWGMFRRNKEGQLFYCCLAAMHTTSHNDTHRFQPEWESEGTQRYLHLLPRLYQLQTRPTVLIIDELERRLHTLLTRRIVEQALDVTPIPRSQFIFTTHDTNLLDRDLLRRDEIWFVDKDNGGASTLTSLAEYKIRNDLDYEKGYLLGRFEAIPYLRNSRQLATALQGDD